MIDDFVSYEDRLEAVIDVVYCIDLTSDMKPISDKIKKAVKEFHDVLQKEMYEKAYRTVRELRVRVIGFRDIYCDGAEAFEESDGFFGLPGQEEEFKAFVDRLEFKGGAGHCSSSMEALSKAIQSDWVKAEDDSVRKRHIIVMFTGTQAHPLEKARGYPGDNYPQDMPKSYIELIDRWSGQDLPEGGSAFNIDQIGKRLVFFAPESCEPWSCVADDFDNCIPYFVEPDKDGLDTLGNIYGGIIYC